MTSVGPHGILLLHKEVGPTSFQVIGKLRRILGTRTIGHAGTLDPLAEGLLVILVGEYTRLSQYLTAHHKQYLAEVNFSGRTNTDDAEGEILDSRDFSDLTMEEVSGGIASFVGDQMQIPPMFSAIKVKGERLYKKARRGEDLDLEGRPVTFFDLELKMFTPPIAVIDVHCSKGTYIRALARDLGERLNVPAHLSGLRRTRSGDYRLEDAYRIVDLEKMPNPRDALLTDVKYIHGIRVINIQSEDARALGYGQSIPCRETADPKATYLACYAGTPVALVRPEDGKMRCIRGFNLLRED